MAAEKVQPVPCTFGVSIHGARSKVTDRPSKATSTASASRRRPPFTITSLGPSRVQLAGGRLHRLEVGDLAAGEQGRLGQVGRHDRGARRTGRGRRRRRPRPRRSACRSSRRARGRRRAAGAHRRQPLGQELTTAAWRASRSWRRARRRSSKTASSWASTMLGTMARNSRTPRVFCAVTAVTTKVPKTPWAAKVRRSAPTPAPAPESVPAMVRATFGARASGRGRLAGRVRTRRRS